MRSCCAITPARWTSLDPRDRRYPVWDGQPPAQPDRGFPGLRPNRDHRHRPGPAGRPAPPVHRPAERGDPRPCPAAGRRRRARGRSAPGPRRRVARPRDRGKPAQDRGGPARARLRTSLPGTPVSVSTAVSGATYSLLVRDHGLDWRRPDRASERGSALRGLFWGRGWRAAGPDPGAAHRGAAWRPPGHPQPAGRGDNRARRSALRGVIGVNGTSPPGPLSTRGEGETDDRSSGGYAIGPTWSDAWVGTGPRPGGDECPVALAASRR